MASDFGEIDKLFRMITSEPQFMTAFQSELNSMMKLASGDERDLESVKKRFESWEELDEAFGSIEKAIEESQAFRAYLKYAESALKRAIRAGLIAGL